MEWMVYHFANIIVVDFLVQMCVAVDVLYLYYRGRRQSRPPVRDRVYRGVPRPLRLSHLPHHILHVATSTRLHHENRPLFPAL